MVLEQVFSPESVILNLESKDKNSLFEEMLGAIISVQPDIDRDRALAALHGREEKMSTGIMHGIAVPHGTCDSVANVVGAIGISRSGIEYDSLDGAPVNLVFMLLCNPNATEIHLAVLKDLASILQNPAFIKEVMEKTSGQEVYDLLCRYKSSLVG